MGRDTLQLETTVSTISQEYLLEFTSEYDISKMLHPELPGPEDRIVDFPKGKAWPRVDVFQQEAWEKYPVMLHQALRFPKKLEQPLLLGGREGVPDYCGLAYECSKRWDAGREYVFPRGCDNTEYTPYPNPEALLCFVGLSRRYYLRDEVKTGSRPRVAHEVSLLTVTTNRVIEMKDPATATDSSWVPSTIERSPLDFTNENPSQQSTGPEDQEAAAPKMPPLRTKSLAAIELGMGSTHPTPAPQGAPVDVSDPEPLSFADPQSRPSTDVTQSSKGADAAGDPESKNTSFASMVGSPVSIYCPELGITNGSMLDAPEAFQDMVDHIAPLGYFSELRHLHNDDFLKQYNVNLARQVAMGSPPGEQQSFVAAGVDSLRAALRRDGCAPGCAKHRFRRRIIPTYAYSDRKSQVDDRTQVALGRDETRVKHEHAKIDLEAIEAYDPEAKAKYITALHALKNLNSSHLTIPVYPEVRDPMDPWACKEEILLADAIAANVSRAEKKKKCRVVCRTHGVGSAHHAQSDGVLVSVPTVAPQGLAILLVDVATQIEISDEASPQLLRSSSLPVIHG
uniref:Uncharacterized protein n=1 Tax=Tanacetum cinerariifolium TaxID=118510 RepID=A0A6L2LC20_TANCI|nr:hypothetical protein [Tanacetum cinerariifolium]